MESKFKVNDRVTVNAGLGFIGRGTVTLFIQAENSKHIDLVEVALDDRGSGYGEDHKVLVPAKDVTLIND
jgi:hypothetical protein